MSLDAFLKLLPAFCKLVRWFTGSKPKPILLLQVEDDSNDAFFLQRILESQGYDCDTASTAEEAIGCFTHTRYACVFVDLRLPRMSGKELLRVVSARAPRTRPVIVCGEPGDLAQLERGHRYTVIFKPVTLDAILDVIGDLKP